MPIIKSSAELRNNYNVISKLCHESREAVFITKNGSGDLVVMSIDEDENLMGRLELYKMIHEGLDDVREGRTKRYENAMADIRRRKTR